LEKFELEVLVSPPIKQLSNKTSKTSVAKSLIEVKETEEKISIDIELLASQQKSTRIVRLRHFGKFRKQVTKIEIPVTETYTAIRQQIDFNVNTQRIVEAILFVAKQPMTPKQILDVFPELERPNIKEVELAIEAITVEYFTRPIDLKRVASGYRFQIKQDLSHWVSRLFEEKPPRYSRALLETLAIIVYKQPVTRADIEDIRGVSVSSSIMQTLLERDWIKVVAHKEVPGRPGLYGTTKDFLDYFNVSSLSELPAMGGGQSLSDLKENAQQQLQATSEQ